MRWIVFLVAVIANSLFQIDSIAKAQDVWEAGLFFQNLSPGELDEYKEYIEKRATDDAVSTSERSIRRCEICLLNLPLFDAVLEIEKEFRADPDNIQVKKMFARACTNIEFQGRARELIDEVLERAEDDTEAILLRSVLAIENEQQLANELEKMEKLAEVEPYAWIVLAKISRNLDHYDDVPRFVDNFLRVRSAEPACEIGLIHLMKAEALVQLDQHLEEAKAELTKAIELIPDSPNREIAKRMLVYVRVVCDGVSETIEVAKRAADPVQELLNIGQSLVSIDCFSQAVDVLAAALELDSTNEEVAYFLARSLVTIDRPDEARQVYAQFRADKMYAEYVAANGERDKILFLAKLVYSADEDPENFQADEDDDIDIYEIAAVAARKILIETPDLKFPHRSDCVYCIVRHTIPKGEFDEAIQLSRELRPFAQTAEDIEWLDLLDEGLQHFQSKKLEQPTTEEAPILRSGNISPPSSSNLK